MEVAKDYINFLNDRGGTRTVDSYFSEKPNASSISDQKLGQIFCHGCCSHPIGRTLSTLQLLPESVLPKQLAIKSPDSAVAPCIKQSSLRSIQLLLRPATQGNLMTEVSRCTRFSDKNCQDNCRTLGYQLPSPRLCIESPTPLLVSAFEPPAAI